MTKFLKSNKRILGAALAFIVAVTAIGGALYANSLMSKAVYDTSGAVTFKEFNEKMPVEDRFFFIGTYIFALDAITDEIYSKAMDSQAALNQYNIYYKSELAGGVWYDISDAADLSSITDSGTSVEQADVDKLYVTVYIDADGKTYDAKTLDSKTLYDDPDPYDLSKLPELNKLYTQYQSAFTEDSKGVDLFYYEQLKAFFDADLREKYPEVGEETDVLDMRLSNLQIAYERLQEQDKSAEAEVVQGLMKKVDSSRRAVIYKKLAVGDGTGEDEEEEKGYELDMLLMVLSNKSDTGSNNIDDWRQIEQSTMPYDVWTNNKKSYTYDQIYKYIESHGGISTVKNTDDNEMKVDPNFDDFLKHTRFKGATSDKEEFKQNDGIISAIHEADADCKATFNDLMNEKIAVPDSHLGQAIGDRENNLYNIAEFGYSEELVNLADELVLLNSISENVVKEQDKELSLIDSELLGVCESGFKALAIGGVGDDYNNAIAQGANEDGIKGALDEQEAKLNKEMTELRFMITAKKMRMIPEDCFNATMGWIDWTDALLSQIPNDEFSSRAKIAVNSHKVWLTDLLAELAKENASDKSELDNLLEQKDALNEEKMAALDANDLNAVKKIDAKLAEIDSLIDKEVANLSEKANDSNASAGERAAAEVGLAGTVEGAINNLKEDAINKMENGEDASDELEALKQLGATDAIAEINAAAGKATDEESAQDSSKDKSDNTVVDSSDKDQKKDKDKDKEKASSGNHTLSEAEIMDILADILGGDFSSLSADGKVVAAVAVDRFGALGNKKAQNIAKNLIEICATEHNKYVYDTYTDGSNEYVNLVSVGKVSDFRYVFQAGGKDGTLANGKESYSFTNGSKEMTIEETKASVKMTGTAIYKYGSLYCPKATIKEYLDLNAEVIDKADYSAIMNALMEAKAKKVLDALKNGGKN